MWRSHAVAAQAFYWRMKEPWRPHYEGRERKERTSLHGQDSRSIRWQEENGAVNIPIEGVIHHAIVRQAKLTNLLPAVSRLGFAGE